MSQARAFLGSGDIYIKRTIAGVPQGMFGPYFAEKFEIKTAVDKKEAISKGRNTRGQVLETVSIQKPAEFTIELSEVNKESMTLALLGTTSLVSQAASTVTDEAITMKLDSWVSLSKHQVSAFNLSETATPGVALVLDVDYALNPQLGMVKALVGGSIANNTACLADFTAAAVTDAVIEGATNADIRAEFLFDGINNADGLGVVVEIDEAVIASNAAFDFLADSFNKVPLTGSMKTQTGKTAPFRVKLRQAA